MDEIKVRAAAIFAKRLNHDLAAVVCADELFAQFGVRRDPATIRRWWRSGRDTALPGRGRRQSFTTRQKRGIVRYVVGNEQRYNSDGTHPGHHSIREAADFFEQKEDRTVAISSISKWLHSSGYYPYHRDKGPLITRINQQQRHDLYDRLHRRPAAFFLNVVFTDSTVVSFRRCTNCKNDIYWAKTRLDVKPRCRKKHPSTVHAYGALTRFGLVGPVFVTGVITARRYIDEVLPRLLPEVQRLFGDTPFIWQQDGAPAHTAAATQSWLADHCTFWRKHEWPGNSADLNVIEQVWPLVQKAATKPSDSSISRIVHARIIRFFRSYSTEASCKLLLSFAKKMPALREANFYGIRG